ncbi:BT2A2 protein, partial [Penelope pileata]|nr:BT2A2 protein [Penelope pileata]
KVMLNPNTAHPQLSLSEDLRSMRWEHTWQHLPDVPERFDTEYCVLGQEEFREGRHCWEVEVMGKDLWCAVGVARASVKRKGKVYFSPKEGIWALAYFKGELNGLTSPPTPVSLSPVPTRIWVCVDCTQGQVTFISAHNGAEIFTFPTAAFNGESVHP